MQNRGQISSPINKSRRFLWVFQSSNAIRVWKEKFPSQKLIIQKLNVAKFEHIIFNEQMHFHSILISTNTKSHENYHTNYVLIKLITEVRFIYKKGRMNRKIIIIY